MNTEAIDLLIQRNPKLKAARSKLEAMQPGAYCMHRSWGFGQIKSYDEGKNKLIIDFEEDKSGHAMDPVFCVDKLEVLPEGNILVRQRQEPEAVEEMIKKRPTDLIAEILAKCENHEASSTELERLLSRLMGPTKFKKWWTQTKKHLVKDPRIAVPSRKTQPYVLREEPVTPEQEILEEFYSLNAPKKKILLAERLYQLSDSVEVIANDLPKILETLTEAIKIASKQLSQADRLHGVWVRNDLARHLHEDVDTLEPTSASIIRESEEHLPELAEQLPSTYYKRLLDLLTRVYPDEHEAVLFELLRNSTGKLTNECINFLIERGFADQVRETLGKWLDEQSLKAPVLYWIVKNRTSRKFSKLLSALISPRLLKAIFFAIDNEALQMSGSRRLPLADILSEDEELIPDLLSTASPETARDLAQTLLLNHGFEDLTKRSLLARFIRQFPGIQSLVSSSSDEDAAASTSSELIVSQDSLDKRKGEYERLINEEIPENKAAIATAREHGDLRENSEYKMAKEDQATLLARKGQLEQDLANAVVTDFKDAPSDVVGIGSVVELTDSSNKSHEFSILGAWDSAPEKNILSYKTPLAQSLISKKPGDKVKTNIDGNEEEWTVKAISRWVEQKV